MSTEAPKGGPERGFPLFISTLALVIAMGALLAVAFKLGDERAQTSTEAARTISAAEAGPTEEVKLTIKSDEEHAKKGPEGTWHDAYLPADFSVKPGTTVRVTVLNYDEAEHTFDSPSLGTNAMIPAGSEESPSETTFTFKAPKKAGHYLWFCTMPCDPWAMEHNGFMRGFVTVA